MNYNLAYLDYQKADAANTANAGSTSLADLVYIQGNMLASGTLQNAPTGADTDFYIFKCESLPAGVLLSTPQGAVHDTGNVMYLGALNQSGTKYLDFFSPLADDVKPAVNEIIDPFDTTQKNFYAVMPGTSSVLLGVSQAASSQPAIDAYMWNANGTAVFETENGGIFGAFCGAVEGSDSAHAAFGVIVHSFNALTYYAPSGSSQFSVTGNQPRNTVYGFPSMPYGPSFGGSDIVPYPANGVDWTTHQVSATEWERTDANGKVYFECSAEFVCTSINGKLYAGLAACHWNGGRVDKMQVMLLPAWFWGAGSMELSFDFDIPDYNDTWYGPDSAPNAGGAGGYIVRQGAAQVADVPARSYFSFVGQGDAGTHCYLINGSALAKLQGAFWSSLVTDEMKQYLMSCVIAVHQMPNELMPAVNASNAVSTVMIGNIPVPVASPAKAQIINPFVSAWKVCSFTATDKYKSLAYFNGGNYLDYEPHVNVTLFLPFAGTIQLPASACIGGKIEVYAASNASNGDVVYTVVTTSDGVILHDVDGSPVVNTYYVAGNCALPIMFTGTTTGQKQRTSDIYAGIGGALSVVAGAATGNAGALMAGVRTMAEAENDLAHIQQNAIQAGGIAGSVAGIGQKQILLRVTRPVKAYDKSWISLAGLRSEICGKLETAKTADSSAFTVVKYCNTSALQATEAEKAEALSLLQGGVFV